ncbi:MAG: hypothetical protein R3A45_03785 [Bdellovibrionota bacterium]
MNEKYGFKLSDQIIKKYELSLSHVQNVDILRFFETIRGYHENFVYGDYVNFTGLELENEDDRDSILGILQKIVQLGETGANYPLYFIQV